MCFHFQTSKLVLKAGLWPQIPAMAPLYDSECVAVVTVESDGEDGHFHIFKL